MESRIETLQTFPVSTGLIVDVVIPSSTEIAFEILTFKRRFMRMAEHYLMKAFHKKCQLKLWMEVTFFSCEANFILSKNLKVS